ncbi:MAG: argininosuccinate lyase [Planctomycetota bacterium]|nr:argininosuccinate lyase [Planctomycetota bacterium]
MASKTGEEGKGGKSWQSRLSAQADTATAKLLASIDVDRALWGYDIAGSMIHARMLKDAGLITAKDLTAICRGLTAIAKDLSAGTLPCPVELEDIHMVIEKALIDRVGEPGRRLHTGRSRNDQVALDLRLWARDAADELTEGVRALQCAFVAMADSQGRIVMPAYTHLQRAQPIVAGHALLAYAEMLDRDVERLADARKRINVCPLGAGAVAGSSLPIDRQATAKLLGFASVAANSIDAVSDRDFLAELCFACTMLAVHLSRWAEDWIIYSTTEFGMLELSDDYCTSSSMMPQKKNADTLELIRGKSASALAGLTGILTLMKGLPLAYNRDMQDDKRFAFSVVEAMHQALPVAAGVVASSRFRRERIAAGLNAGFLDATALAEYLVNHGKAFRQAHQLVGRLVAHAEAAGKTLSQLPLETLREFCGPVGKDVYDYLGPANVVAHYRPEGAGGTKQLDQQLLAWKKRLG